MPNLCQYPQEQLTTLTELRELVVHMDRPLQDEKGLRCLPLLVFAHRAQYTPEASLRLSARCILKSSSSPCSTVWKPRQILSAWCPDCLSTIEAPSSRCVLSSVSAAIMFAGGVG